MKFEGADKQSPALLGVAYAIRTHFVRRAMGAGGFGARTVWAYLLQKEMMMDPISRCGKPLNDEIGRPRLTIVKRSSGQTSVASWAYIARTCARDEQTGELFNYSQRDDLVSVDTIGWGGSGQDLWNAAERAESRCNAQVARSWVLPLPADLSEEQMQELGKKYGAWINKHYGTACALAVHRPDAGSKNYHIHLLETTRRMTIGEDGSQVLGPKVRCMTDTNGAWRGGPSRSKVELWRRREMWERFTNDALEDAGAGYRVDFSSYAQQVEEGRRDPQIPTEHRGWQRSTKSSTSKSAPDLKTVKYHADQILVSAADDHRTKAITSEDALMHELAALASKSVGAMSSTKATNAHKTKTASTQAPVLPTQPPDEEKERRRRAAIKRRQLEKSNRVIR